MTRIKVGTDMTTRDMTWGQTEHGRGWTQCCPGHGRIWKWERIVPSEERHVKVLNLIGGGGVPWEVPEGLY